MSPSRAPMIALDVATEADAGLLSNLLELYARELSEVFPHVVPGPDGRFSYPSLPRYWSEPDRRFAFIIRAEGEVAGFVLATLGSPATEDPDVLDVAEFFVLNEYRRRGVGRRAALMLWRQLRGVWTVRVAEGNRAGLAFWAGVLGAVSDGVTVSTLAGERATWRIYRFDSTVLQDSS